MRIVCYLAFALALLAACLSYLLTINEYQAIGIAGGVDCDGPGMVFYFSLSAMIFALLTCALNFSRHRAGVAQSAKTFQILAIALILVSSLRCYAAYKEMNTTSYLATCDVTANG